MVACLVEHLADKTVVQMVEHWAGRMVGESAASMAVGLVEQ